MLIIQILEIEGYSLISKRVVDMNLRFKQRSVHKEVKPQKDISVCTFATAELDTLKASVGTQELE